jgi:hypothetical protein
VHADGEIGPGPAGHPVEALGDLKAGRIIIDAQFRRRYHVRSRRHRDRQHRQQLCGRAGVVRQAFVDRGILS